VAVATEMGLEFDTVLYMSEKPDEATLRDLIAKLEDPVENLVRKDSQFKKLELDEDDYVENPDAVVAVLLRYPRLMQRPVIVLRVPPDRYGRRRTVSSDQNSTRLERLYPSAEWR